MKRLPGKVGKSGQKREADGQQQQQQQQRSQPAAKVRRVGGRGGGGVGGVGGRKSAKAQRATASGGGLRQVGRWKPEDDLLLVQSVLALRDLRAVHCCVRFTCAFTEAELKERWRALMFDDKASRLSEQAVRHLPAPLHSLLLRRAPFSHEEEELLEVVAPSEVFPDGRLSLGVFERLLSERPDVFGQSRCPKSLQRHWQLLRRHGLLRACPPPAWPVGAPPTDFLDAEYLVEKFRSAPSPEGPAAGQLTSELRWEARRARRRLCRLEEEARLWQTAARDALPSGAGRLPEPGDSFVSSDGRQGLALLKGARASFLISGVCVSIGRRTDACHVDIDLGVEGPSSKVSRVQAHLRVRESGTFVLENVGRRPLFVNGEAVESGEACALSTQSVLLVAGLAFRFLVNPELMSNASRPAVKQCPKLSSCRNAAFSKVLDNSLSHRATAGRLWPDKWPNRGG